MSEIVSFSRRDKALSDATESDGLAKSLAPSKSSPGSVPLLESDDGKFLCKYHTLDSSFVSVARTFSPRPGMEGKLTRAKAPRYRSQPCYKKISSKVAADTWFSADRAGPLYPFSTKRAARDERLGEKKLYLGIIRNSG